MKDYARLTRAELIELIRELDQETAANKAQQAESTHERRQAQAALRDSEERLRAILATAVEGIITIDERGIIESANRAAERIFGYSAPELIGKNVSVLMPSPYREGHNDYLANYVRTGKARIIGIGREVIGQRKDGATFPMDLAVSEVRLANRRLFTGFVRDITERKQLEQEILEISSREQQRIGQDLHDDLCQQLTGIELMCQVLEQKLAAKSKSASERAGEIARHVREAITHTRGLARGLSPVEFETNGFMSALQELAANVQKLFHVQCRFECPEPVLIQSNTAATHLYRIVQEAINNAIKHGKASRIVIALQYSGGGVVLSVADNGSGFPATWRATAGLGLRIMKYRAGMVGAALEWRPANGRGAIVSCAFNKDL